MYLETGGTPVTTNERVEARAIARDDGREAAVWPEWYGLFDESERGDGEPFI